VRVPVTVDVPLHENGELSLYDHVAVAVKDVQLASIVAVALVVVVPGASG